MTELLAFLKNLITTPGLSGYESPIRQLIEEVWRPLTNEMTVSRLGSLHALKRGSAAEPRSSLMITAHMDIIGLMVTSISDEFLHVTEVGGIDPRVLPGQPVTVHGRKELPGLIVQPPAHLLPPENNHGPVKLENLLVDLGLEGAEVKRLVRPGDLVSFAQPPIEMQDEVLVGRSLDNRASIAVLTGCLQELKSRPLRWDLWAVASTQEEETLGGGATSTYQLHPDLAVILDVTFASSPGSSGYKTFPMGEGLTLGYGPNVHPALHKAFKELAEKLEIPCKDEFMPRHSGTEAYSIQVAAEGMPTMIIGIPIRYMHTQVEMVSMKDISRTGRLLAEFTASLDEKFMDKLNWSDG